MKKGLVGGYKDYGSFCYGEMNPIKGTSSTGRNEITNL